MEHLLRMCETLGLVSYTQSKTIQQAAPRLNREAILLWTAAVSILKELGHLGETLWLAKLKGKAIGSYLTLGRRQAEKDKHEE